MEDRSAAIPAGEDMIEPAGDVESWLAGHGGERTVRELLSHYACPTSISLKAKTYFATPYASWERGINENTNGLLRQSR